MNVFKTINFIKFCCWLLLLYGFLLSDTMAQSRPAIVIENAGSRLLISSSGKALSLIDKVSGQECLKPDFEGGIFSLTQYTAYSNELQLMLPAGKRTFDVRSVIRRGDTLEVRFNLVNIVAFISLHIRDTYLAFTLERIGYDPVEFGDQRPTAVDEFCLLRLPVKDRAHFGEWLNVGWDSSVAVNLLAADPYLKINSGKFPGYQLMQATAVASVRLKKVTAALITCPPQSLLNNIEQLEQDFGLPPGVASRRCPAYGYSYLEPKKLTPDNVSTYIRFARQAGIRAIQVLWSDFALSAGHFPYRSEYPNGINDLKAIVDSIRAAGMLAGLHIHYNKASISDAYISPHPDYRLNLREYFTLSDSLNCNDTLIRVEEDPSRCTLDEGRRILKIGNELISYENFSTQYPFAFKGCRRGLWGSGAQPYPRGMKLGLLDVDTWNIFVRFDQRSSIQQEVAERIGRIYREAGFSFLYFDGAEDVPAPYWYNTGMAQLKLFKALNSPMLFAEGALKSHYSWHLLSRGNAFDLFDPSVFKKAVDHYPLQEATMLENDFSAVNFGWMDYSLPSSKSGGLQPDMIEYVCSKAAAFNCPVSLLASLSQLQEHPRTADNLEVLRRWETARLSGFFTNAQRQAMRKPGYEVTLLHDRKGAMHLQAVKPVSTKDSTLPLKIFLFEQDGKTLVQYWHLKGSEQFFLRLPAGSVKLYHELDEPAIPVVSFNDGIVLPAAERRILVCSLPPEQVLKALTHISRMP